MNKCNIRIIIADKIVPNSIGKCPSFFCEDLKMLLASSYIFVPYRINEILLHVCVFDRCCCCFILGICKVSLYTWRTMLLTVCILKWSASKSCKIDDNVYSCTSQGSPRRYCTAIYQHKFTDATFFLKRTARSKPIQIHYKPINWLSCHFKLFLCITNSCIKKKWHFILFEYKRVYLTHHHIYVKGVFGSFLCALYCAAVWMTPNLGSAVSSPSEAPYFF